MLTKSLHLDFETFSLADLKSVGAARYAFDPSTEILCAAMALNDEEPDLWSQLDDGGERLEKYWDALEDPEVLIWAHSAQFEMFICQALLQKTWNIKCPDLRLGYKHQLGGNGVSASLRAVQFVRDGESFGAGPVDPNEEFEPVSSDVDGY